MQLMDRRKKHSEVEKNKKHHQKLTHHTKNIQETKSWPIKNSEHYLIILNNIKTNSLAIGFT